MITVQRVAKAAGKHLTRTALKLRQALGARASRGCPACGRTVVGFFRYGDNPEWGCPACGAWTAHPARLLTSLQKTKGGGRGGPELECEHCSHR